MHPSRRTFDSFDYSTTLPFEQLCATLETIIPRIASALTELAFVLVRAKVDFVKSQQQVERVARAFWELDQVP
jgi:hypothetical protein